LTSDLTSRMSAYCTYSSIRWKKLFLKQFRVDVCFWLACVCVLDEWAIAKSWPCVCCHLNCQSNLNMYVGAQGGFFLFKRLILTALNSLLTHVNFKPLLYSWRPHCCLSKEVRMISLLALFLIFKSQLFIYHEQNHHRKDGF
jgi:hypothetical protein